MDEYVVIFRSHSSFFYRKDRDKELQVVFTLYRIGLIGKKKYEYYIRKE